MDEFLSVYSQNTPNYIKQYLEGNIYPQEITSLTYAFMREKKFNFREIGRKNQRYKLVSTKKWKNIVILQELAHWKNSKIKILKLKKERKFKVNLQKERLYLRIGI